MHTLCIYAYTHTCIHYYIHTYVGRDNTMNRSYVICSCTKVCKCKYASDANVQNVIKAHSPHHETYIHTYIHTYTHTHTYIHTYIHIYIHTYITHVHNTHIHIYIHTCMHT